MVKVVKLGCTEKDHYLELIRTNEVGYLGLSMRKMLVSKAMER